MLRKIEEDVRYFRNMWDLTESQEKALLAVFAEREKKAQQVTFDVLDLLVEHVPSIRGGYARWTGAIDMDFIRQSVPDVPDEWKSVAALQSRRAALAHEALKQISAVLVPAVEALENSE